MLPTQLATAGNGTHAGKQPRLGAFWNGQRRPSSEPEKVFDVHQRGADRQEAGDGGEQLDLSKQKEGIEPRSHESEINQAGKSNEYSASRPSLRAKAR
jgi:hypothetical protein